MWHVVLPGALPQALTGLRLSVIASLLALVVGEQINANAGLGFMMNQAETFLANNVIVVALIVYALLGVIADSIVRLIERKALAWRQEFTLCERRQRCVHATGSDENRRRPADDSGRRCADSRSGLAPGPCLTISTWISGQASSSR